MKMIKAKHGAVSLFALALSGCAPMDSALGRVLLLVVVPALILGGILWLIRGRDGGPRGRVHPDHDRDED